MMDYPMHCPRCSAFVKILYVDTAGTHWVCPVCGRNSDNYTVVYDQNTGGYKEISYTNRTDNIESD